MRTALVITLVFLVSSLTFFGFTYIIKPPETKIEQFFLGGKNLSTNQEAQKDKIENLISQELPKLEGAWAIAIKDLKTGYIYWYNQEAEIPSASLYKLATMWAVFDSLDKGGLQKTDALSDFLTIESALTQMITISDNDAAILLSEKLGWTNITRLMQKEGLGGFNLSTENPTTTAKSTLDLLERIYRGTAVTSKASQEMKTLLFNQKINDRIPEYLPGDVAVAHKTGELENLRHDAGIVIGENSHYIFVFLSDTPNPSAAVETIAGLSKKIFDLLEQL